MIGGNVWRGERNKVIRGGKAYLNIDVVLLPLFGLELAPDHLAVMGALVLAEPAFELVVGRHVDKIASELVLLVLSFELWIGVQKRR